MSVRSFRAMGTEWYVDAAGVGSSVLEAAERIVREEERRFSRFRSNSALSELNRRRALREPVVAGVMRRALRYRRQTRGAFDPGVGAALLAAGYDRSFEELPPAPEVADGGADASACRPACADARRPEIDVRGQTVRLRGEGFVDLGGIVKGWTVDRVAAHLRGAGARAVLVDGGGDIRVDGDGPARGPDGRGWWPIGVGDGMVVRLSRGGVATSSVRRRRWAIPAGPDGVPGGWAHHVIAPDAGAPAAGPILTATVVARDATAADVLATTLIVDLNRGLDAASSAGAAVLVENAGGWQMTASMERYLS